MSLVGGWGHLREKDAVEAFRRGGGDVVPQPRNAARGDIDGDEAVILGSVVSELRPAARRAPGGRSRAAPR
ncbi:hypothetical protein ACWEJ6_25455 [Nonomuraea sp. NPDC004702]